MAKLTKQVNAPSILQEAAGAQSAPGSVSGDSISSESAVPVYSGERLALCVGEADINLEHDPHFRHLSHQWNQAFEGVAGMFHELETDRPPPGQRAVLRRPCHPPSAVSGKSVS